MKKTVEKVQIVFCFLILVLFIFFSFLNLEAAETINPDTKLKIILNNFQNENGNLTIGAESESN